MNKLIFKSPPTPVQNTIIINEECIKKLWPNTQISLISAKQPIIIDAINVFELFKKTQEKVSSTYNLQKCSLRGSFVTHLFTGEPFHDVDVHMFIDLTRVDKNHLFSTGTSIKWKILEAIKDMVNSKLSSPLINSLEHIPFEERFVLGATKGWSPFNIHMIRVGQNPPVEFTFFGIVKESFSEQRFFDFNNSSLELMWNEKLKKLTLHSLQDNVSQVLHEIEERVLSCPSPGQLIRKATARYLQKLTFSGYHDKNSTLLIQFLEDFKTRQHRAQEHNEIIQKILQEIKDHFVDHNIDYFTALLHLYFTHSNTDLLTDLKTESITFLLLELGSKRGQTFENLNRLISLNAKAECAFYLICHSQEIHLVTHRDMECLQLKIPLESLYEKEETSRGMFYLLIPIINLWQLKELTSPQIFINILNAPNQFESYSEKAITSLKAILSTLLLKPSFCPVLLALLTRLKIGPNKDSAKLLLQQAPFLNQLFKKGLPPSFLIQCFNALDTSIHLPLSTCSILVNQIQINLSPKELVDYENALHYPFFTHFATELVQNSHSAVSEDFNWDNFLQHLCEYQKFVIFDSMDICEINLLKLKKNINLSYLLFKKGLLPPKIALNLFESCLRRNFIKEGLCIFKSIIIHEDRLDQTDIEKNLMLLIGYSTPDFFDFLESNKRLLKNKILNHDLLFISIIEKISLLPDALSYESNIINLINYFYDLVSCKNLNFFIFYKASFNDSFCISIIRNLIILKKLDLKQMKLREVLSEEETIFLFTHENLKIEIVEDHDFENFVIHWALKYNLYKNLSNLIHETIPLRSSFEPQFLKILALIGKERSLFIESLHLFLLISENLEYKDIELEFIFPMLDALALFCSSKDSEIKFLKDSYNIAHLSAFHKKFAFKTLQHPVWTLLWSKLATCEFKYPTVDWIELNDLDILIENPQALVRLQNFIKAFDMDHFLICHIFEKINNFDSHKQKAYWDTIFHLLADKSFFLFIERSSKHLNEQTAALFTFTIAIEFISKMNPSETTLKDVQQLMSLLLFAITFGSTDVRQGAFDFFANLLNFDKTPFASLIKSTGYDEEIIFTAADKALQERNFSELKKINDLISSRYIELLGDEKYFSTFKFFHLLNLPSLCNWRLDYWMRILKLIYQKNSTSLLDTEAESSLAALNYFSRYLTLVIISISYMLKTKSAENLDFIASIQKNHLQALFRLIDLVSTKKFIRTFYPFTHLLSLVGYLTKEQAFEFTSKFLNYATNQINSIDYTSAVTEEQILARLLLKQATGYFLHIRIDQKLKKETDAAFIFPLLEASRSHLNCFNAEGLIDSEFLNTLSCLEGSMNLQDTQAYHRKWLLDIVSRSQTVSFDELTLFTLTTFRNDPKFSESFPCGGDNKYFKNKPFINKDYFTPSVIKSFISLFDTLFSRFSHRIQPSSQNHKEMDLDAFSLLPAFKGSIDAGLINMKNSAECEKIKTDFLDVLLKALEHKNTSLTLPTLQAVFRYLIKIDKDGSADFHIRTKAQMAKNIAIFYKLALFLIPIPNVLILDVCEMTNQLMKVYELHQGLFRKELTNEQNESISAVLLDKLSQQLSPTSHFVQTSDFSGCFTDEGKFFDMDVSLKCLDVFVKSPPDQ
jgi:hypothetical protein